jgi:hypothetical protein
VKALFDRADVGVFFPAAAAGVAVATEEAGLGELVEAFWKKPMMERCVLPVPVPWDPEAGPFFWEAEARGVDMVLFSWLPRAIIIVENEETERKQIGEDKSERWM